MSEHRGKTTSEAEFRRLWMDRTLTQREIGEILGISTTAVQFRAKARGLPPRKKKVPIKALSLAKDPLFVEMMKANVMRTHINRYFGAKENVVNIAAKLAGVDRGPRNRWNKITVGEFFIRRAMAEEAEAFDRQWGKKAQVAEMQRVRWA